MLKTATRGLMTLCAAALLLSAGDAAAQRRMRQQKLYYNTPDYVEPSGWALGMNLGLSDLWGDVGTASIVDHYTNENYYKRPHFMGGVFLRYTAHPALGIRLGANYGTLYADDYWNYTKAKSASSFDDDAVQRYYRNLNVRTNIWEGTLSFEINPLRIGNLENRKKMNRRFQPYILAGVGAFHFQPYGEYIRRDNGQKRWVRLKDLHLEGDGFKAGDGSKLLADAPEEYDLWQLCVPLGLGVRWDIGKQLGFGVEYLYRYTMTDQIDNVSTEYIDPALFDANLNVRDAALARDMYDKSYAIDPGITHTAGQKRGNSAVNDGYSTISFSFFYKIQTKKAPWWWKYN